MNSRPTTSTLLWSHKYLLVLLAALVGCAATPVKAERNRDDDQVQREEIVSAMENELKRSMALQFRDYQKPYFISYQIKDMERVAVEGKFGSISYDNYDRARSARVEIRVGDYRFDNFANVETESYRASDYAPDRRIPLDGSSEGIQGTLWLLTDEAYKQAVSDMLTKKGGAVFATDASTKVESFSKEVAARHRGDMQPIRFDADRWGRAIEKVTESLLAFDELLESEMTVSAKRTVRYFVNSEGTSIIDEFTLYSLQVSAWARADDGALLENTVSFYSRTSDEMPPLAEVLKGANEMARELVALRQAPPLDPYTGPAILAPKAAGVLFHETVGHRLEGERQRSDEEGRTFKGQIGQVVLPTFLSIYDDPTVPAHGAYQLNGHYAFDEEGVVAQRTVLVENGILRHFLKSRTPIEGSPQSNGHGRSQSSAKPMARMANLFVTVDPAMAVPYNDLKAQLLAEVRKQKKPFGLIIRDITGGATNTSGYGFQAFKGFPRLTYRVDAITGEETLVRGVELVGTPLASINKIVAGSIETDVFNGYCGAESGYVPVSMISPALLTTEIELQRTQTNKQRPPILGAPWVQTKDKN